MNIKHAKILDKITDTIYLGIFGMDSEQMIEESQNHIPDGWEIRWDSDDENMRDMLSLQALGVLAAIEKHCADDIDFAVSNLQSIIELHKVNNMVIWGDEV